MNEITIKEAEKNAGKIWDIISRTVTGVPVHELSKQLALSFDEVFSAIRCLARDFNIGLANDNNGRLVVIGVQ